jgi:hypothetical protein
VPVIDSARAERRTGAACRARVSDGDGGRGKGCTFALHRSYPYAATGPVVCATRPHLFGSAEHTPSVRRTASSSSHRAFGEPASAIDAVVQVHSTSGMLGSKRRPPGGDVPLGPPGRPEGGCAGRLGIHRGGRTRTALAPTVALPHGTNCGSERRARLREERRLRRSVASRRDRSTLPCVRGG